MEQEINNSEVFLKSVLQNSVGFSVPKDYFNTAEDRFSSFLIERELPEETGFSIPENYFQNVEKSILKKTGFKNVGAHDFVLSPTKTNPNHVLYLEL